MLLRTSHSPRRHRPRRRAAGAGWTVALLAPALLTAGCSGNQNAFNPKSKPADEIATLGWIMIAVSFVVLLGAIGIVLLSWRRRKKEGFPLLGERDAVATGAVVVFGFVIPAVCLVFVFGFSNFDVLRTTEAPAVSSTRMTIQVIGHQWFWEVRYPGTTAVTANEIHIPTGTRVNVVGTTDDVIHSLWVPQLNKKIDLIPGHPNRMLWYASRPGRFRGQCAEFCGFQHAHMSLYVFAEAPAQFRAWLANMAANARSPATAAQRDGLGVFLTLGCSSCHTIRGTGAVGTVGPDLTHVQTRTTLAALTIPNTKGYLAGWVADPQHVKPGNRMPALNFTGPQFQALLDYLESLH